jgi:hypothetical protein
MVDIMSGEAKDTVSPKKKDPQATKGRPGGLSIHKTLRITPAMAAGVSDHVWELEEIAQLAN